MPRPEIPELQVYWKIRLSATLAARIEMAMWDTTLRKPKYGSRKALIEHLLSEWLQKETQTGAAAQEGQS